MKQLKQNSEGALAPARRNNYYYGKLLDAPHLQMEQAYFKQKIWMLNRLSLGMGVLCGLNVIAKDGLLWITPGVAIDGLGREIIVNEMIGVDPWQVSDEPGGPVTDLDKAKEWIVSLGICYRECPVDYRPVLVSDCDNGDKCAPGTILESFWVVVSEGRPADLPESPTTELCQALRGGGSVREIRQALCGELNSGQTCGNQPASTCVTLAVARLSDGEIQVVDTCTFRPVVYSNATLLDLILCLAERVEECCGPRTDVKWIERVSVDHQSGQPNQPVSEPPVVRVLLNNNPLPNEPVTFRVTDGGQIGLDTANLGVIVTINTDANGLAELPVWILGPNQGGYSLQASITGGSPGSVDFQAAAKTDDVKLLRVMRIEYLRRDMSVLEVVDRPAFEMQLKETYRPAIIRVTFDGDLDPATLTPAQAGSNDPATFSFLVEKQETGGQAAVPGFVTVDPNHPDQALFIYPPSTTLTHVSPDYFRVGEYGGQLFGEQDTPQRDVIRSVDGSVLDGENRSTAGWNNGDSLSGDGLPGGIFKFTFSVG